MIKPCTLLELLQCLNTEVCVCLREWGSGYLDRLDWKNQDSRSLAQMFKFATWLIFWGSLNKTCLCVCAFALFDTWLRNVIKHCCRGLHVSCGQVLTRLKFPHGKRNIWKWTKALAKRMVCNENATFGQKTGELFLELSFLMSSFT